MGPQSSHTITKKFVDIHHGVSQNQTQHGRTEGFPTSSLHNKLMSVLRDYQRLRVRQASAELR